MADSDFRIVIEHNGLPQMSALLEKKLDRGLAKIAKDIERDAKTRAPVDTGNLKSSIGSGRVDHLLYEIVAKANYAAFVEFGTVRMGAQPFLGPAVERQRQTLADVLASIVEQAAREAAGG